MSRALTAGFIYFLIVFAIGFALGAFRVLILEPAAGALIAAMVELPFMLSASWLVCEQLRRRLAMLDAAAPNALMGLSAFVFLIAAEAALARFGFGQSLSEFWSGFSETPKLMGLAGQIAFGAFPLIQTRSA